MQLDYRDGVIDTLADSEFQLKRRIRELEDQLVVCQDIVSVSLERLQAVTGQLERVTESHRRLLAEWRRR